MNRYFIITIDTEGDNLWSVRDIRQIISTQNAGYLFRFQELCEKYGFITTYLTNYEMARDATMIEMGRGGIKKKSLEIGMHVHAWNQPPHFWLMKSIFQHGKPYLAEYPGFVINKKIEYLTKTLEDTFQCPITSHRGGRWCLDRRIIDCLVGLGFFVDCTCTPGVSWSDNPGWTINGKGTDWSQYNNEPVYLRTHKTEILEIPVSIERIKGHNRWSWLRPTCNNTEEMIQVIEECKNKNEYLEFMIHSSELMPGGSPLAEKPWEINLLFENIETIFRHISSLGYKGISLSDYARLIKNRKLRTRDF